MLDYYIISEDIDRTYNCITNKNILTECLLKEIISDIKIISTESSVKNKILNLTNNQNTNTMNNSNPNIIDIYSKQSINNSIINITTNLNSSNLSNLVNEGAIIECNYLKKYNLQIKISKLLNTERFYKKIELDCIEMNHYLNCWSLYLELFWDSFKKETSILIKINPINKIVDEVIKREFNKTIKDKIFNRIKDYLLNDLTNIINYSTILVKENMNTVFKYLQDIQFFLKYLPDNKNNDLIMVNSKLNNIGQIISVLNKNTNEKLIEYKYSGYHMERKTMMEYKLEKTKKNSSICTIRMCSLFLDEKNTLILFKHIYKTHIPSNILYNIGQIKKHILQEIKNIVEKNNLNNSNGNSEEDDNKKCIIIINDKSEKKNDNILNDISSINCTTEKIKPKEFNNINNNRKESNDPSNIKDTSKLNNSELIFNSSISAFYGGDNNLSIKNLGLEEEEILKEYLNNLKEK